MVIYCTNLTKISFLFQTFAEEAKGKRACAKRAKQQNKMATTFDSDENNSELSSEEECGFFQMAESDEGFYAPC